MKWRIWRADHSFEDAWFWVEFEDNSSKRIYGSEIPDLDMEQDDEACDMYFSQWQEGEFSK